MPLTRPSSPVGTAPGLPLEYADQHAWHPVALSRELRSGGWLQVRLLGRTWRLFRTADGVLLADPPAHDVREHAGLIWLAPAAPRAALPSLPELLDRRFLVAWAPPLRSGRPAAELVARIRRTAPLAGPAAVPVTEPVAEPPGGLRMWIDTGAGTATALVVLTQPEDDDSTRLYACLALTAGPRLPHPATVAAEAAELQRFLTDQVA